MQGLAFLIPLVGVVAACVVLGVNRALLPRAEAAARTQASTSTGSRTFRRGARPCTRDARQRAVHGQGAGAGLREAARGRRVPVLGAHDVPRTRRARPGARAPRASSSPRVQQAAVRRDRTEPGLSWDTRSCQVRRRARHPERFVRGRPMQKSPPAAAWINPPPLDPITITRADRNEEVAVH
jgi:hypothetical protein